MESYKSVIVRCFPSSRQEQLFEHAFLEVRHFSETSLTEFQKTLYHAVKNNGTNLPMRTVSLLARRFSRTVMKNEVIPVDKDSYSIVKKRNSYYARVKLLGDRPRISVVISRRDCDYYAELFEGTHYGAFFFKQSDQIFLCVSVPLQINYNPNRQTVYFGVDLNMYKHAASLFNPQTGEYEKNLFFDLRNVDKEVKEQQRKISLIQQDKITYNLTNIEKKKINKHYASIKEIIKKGHGDFISRLITVANGYWDDGYNTFFVLEDLKGITKRKEKTSSYFNRWLHSQWCYRKFAVMLETKGHRVEYVNPRNTSKMCHKCGSKGVVYGHHERLFKCNHCGLVDFNRDLNAARNIAGRGLAT